VHATLFQIYFNDPFLAYAYTGSIAFFVALYRHSSFLGHVRRGEVLLATPSQALRNDQVLRDVSRGFLVGAEAYFS